MNTERCVRELMPRYHSLVGLNPLAKTVRPLLTVTDRRMMPMEITSARHRIRQRVATRLEWQEPVPPRQPDRGHTPFRMGDLFI